MIFILARGLEDARQWCAFNGVARMDTVYLGSTWALQGRRLTPSDRIVRTALHLMHPDSQAIEHEVACNLAVQALTETVHGNLVPRSA